jgi:hypothetical protein
VRHKSTLVPSPMDFHVRREKYRAMLQLGDRLAQAPEARSSLPLPRPAFRPPPQFYT